MLGTVPYAEMACAPARSLATAPLELGIGRARDEVAWLSVDEAVRKILKTLVVLEVTLDSDAWRRILVWVVFPCDL